ncbi:GNAT family N-acetyltransferase [Paenibacillus solani]|uniref:GNAT family N-acetyltransferase n=1 Tax=Paenibacillus solani TaxID=1705565 RepID=UPI003D2D205F
MLFRMTTMTAAYADQILLWSYEPPYDFYNSDQDEESRRELLENSYYAILDEEEQLYGFYCTGPSAQVPAGIPLGAYDEDLLDFGLGMKPEFTGKGLGKEFLSFVLASIAELQDHKPLRLTVAAFNQRAIRLYTGHGFTEVTSFDHRGTTFITMVQR